MAGQELLGQIRLSPILLIGPVAVAVVALLLFALGPTGVGLGMYLLLVAIVFGLLRCISFATSEFAVTNQARDHDQPSRREYRPAQAAFGSRPPKRTVPEHRWRSAV